MLQFPFRVFALSAILLWVSAQIGIYLRKRKGGVDDHAREDLERLLNTSLTTLGLIIGFTFSMAMSEYHQRLNCEEAEANAIAILYARTGLLPAADAAKVRELLSKYLDQRILFYTAPSGSKTEEITATSARLQSDIRASIQAVALANPTPTMSLAVSGSNDVLNAKGSTQAAWATRIPIAAWALLETFAVLSNVVFGYIARSTRRSAKRFLLLPLVVSISFFFIADMDSPRDGLIPIVPHNLTSLAASMQAH